MGRAGTPWGGQGQWGRSPAQRPLTVGLPRLMGFLPGPPVGAAPPDAALMPTLRGRAGTPLLPWGGSPAELSAALRVVLNNSERGQVVPWPTDTPKCG